MNRIESGRASRAQGSAISTQHSANTEAFTFARINGGQGGAPFCP